MPTGYTAAIVDGKITEFPDFALSCARAFGALIMMRDDPADAPIPEEFKPSDYSEKRLAESRARLAEIQAMTVEQVETAAQSAYDEVLASHNKYEAQEELAEQRLEAMLEKVTAWSPPTAEHVGLKDFMIEQINVSRRGTYRSKPPEQMTGADWQRAQIETLHKDIAYHAGEQAKEIERARGRTEWVKVLRASLSPKEDAA